MSNSFRTTALLVLLSILSSCASPEITYNGKILAGRDATVSGSGTKVNLKKATVRSGRDIKICSDKGLVLPEESIKAPRDVVVSGKC